MPQESAHETNNATNSSAAGKKFVVYQEVNFVSEKHSLVLYTSMKLPIFLSRIFFFLFSGFVKLEPTNLEWYKCNSHGSEYFATPKWLNPTD